MLYRKNMLLQQFARLPEGYMRRADITGFTLVEIMVVVVILAVLAALVVPRVVGRTDEARAVAAKQDIASTMQAHPPRITASDGCCSSTENFIPGTRRLKTALHPLSDWGTPARRSSPSVAPECGSPGSSPGSWSTRSSPWLRH